MPADDEFETVFDTLGIAQTAMRSEGGAIAREHDQPDTDDRRLMDALPRLGQGDGSDLAFFDTIGEGGMGIVRVAEQHGIGREVAVKTLRPDRQEPRFALQLLREAWMTGALEHPNIVPVYSIGIDENGHPMIVMKRIEGTLWSEIIHDSKRELETNLRTLMQVCNAVEFGAARGILHRDLKPDNVMIGTFGEVYVLDWGIAVSLTDDRGGRIPLAREAQGVCGTPGYMAPEMVRETGDELSERTDVYLLGAVLHEVLTKKRRHTGASLRDVLLSSMASEPVEYPEEIPAALAEICNRATHVDPRERFTSAREFRLVLEAYLEHESSRRLSKRASLRLDVWASLSGEAARDPLRIQNLFGECRFGFQEALRTWPENDEARAGLRESLERMFEFELDRDQFDAAASLLAELAQRRPDLRRRLEELEARLARRRSELDGLRDLQADRDLSVGVRTRAFLMLLTGFAWGGFPLGLAWMRRSDMSVGYLELYVVSAVKLIDALILTWWARESLTKTAVNRQLTSVMFLLVVMEAGVRPFAARLGHPVDHSLLIDFGVYLAVFTVVAITVDRRLGWAPVVYLFGAAFVYWRPDDVLYALSVSHFLAFVYVAAVWRPEQLIDPRRRRSKRS